MTPRPSSKPAPSLAVSLLALAALLACGCKQPEKKQSPTEWLDENTTILYDLGSYDRPVRQRAVSRFQKLAQEQGVEQAKSVVVFLLSDPKLQEERQEVVLARLLADWRDARAVPFLIRHLESQDRGVTEMAREGLQPFAEDARVLDAAGELLEKPEREPRITASALLSEVKQSRATEILAAHLPKEDDREVKGQCLMGIIESKHPRRREFLLPALEDADPEIRAAAWDSLQSEKPPPGYDPTRPPSEQAAPLAALKAWAAK